MVYFTTGLFLLSIPLVAAQNALVDLLGTQPDLSTLADALSIVPDLVGVLGNATNITILAPVNDAFARVSNDTAEGLALSTRDANGTAALLSYHVLNGSYPSSSFTDVATYYSTLFNQDALIMGTVRTNVTAGQNLGLVRDGGNYTIISGELQTSNVVQAASALPLAEDKVM